MNSNNNRCHQAGCACQRCSNGKFNCTGVRPFRTIDASCIPPNIPEPQKLAYGSFYNLTEFYDLITPVTPPALGQKIIFTTPGPMLGVNPAPIPNNNTDLQVATSGVYEISMNISVDLVNASNDLFNSDVRFGLFINDTIMVPESFFESINNVFTEIGAPAVTVEIGNTIGNTIQIRLNKDDRLSIRVITASAAVSYRFPSLVVTKIDN